jgi:hypothetical protein
MKYTIQNKCVVKEYSSGTQLPHPSSLMPVSSHYY